PPKGVLWSPAPPDAAFVVAMNFDTRVLDTLGYIRTPKVTYLIKANGTQINSITSVVSPIPTSDDWALLADGSVAFIRWRDYHIDYRAPDGALTSSPKLAYDWQHLVDE